MDNPELPQQVDDQLVNSDEDDNHEQDEHTDVEDDDEVELHQAQDIIDQHRKPRKGDIIKAMVNQYWRIIKLTSNENRTWKNYYNFKLEDGSEDGMYLRPGSNYWTFRIQDADDREDEIDIERRDDDNVADDDRLITPDTSDGERDSTMTEDEAQEYFDDEYEDQDSIFGDANIDYLTNSFESAVQEARHEEFTTRMENTVNDDTGRAYRLVQRLNLELPTRPPLIPISGEIVPNQIYIIPPDWRLPAQASRSRILSVSSSGLNAEPNPIRPSVWQRRFHHLHRFVGWLRRRRR